MRVETWARHQGGPTDDRQLDSNLDYRLHGSSLCRYNVGHIGDVPTSTTKRHNCIENQKREFVCIVQVTNSVALHPIGIRQVEGCTPIVHATHSTLKPVTTLPR